MKITSAHALAFVALVASLGGGYAVAHNGDTDKIHFCIANEGGNVRAVKPDATCAAGETPQDVRIQNFAYQESTAGSHRFAATPRFRPVSKRLIVEADGTEYALSGKLTVSKRRSDRGGNVTCALDSTDNTPADRQTVTVGPGESAALSFINRGKTDGRPGQVADVKISCRSARSGFTVSDAKVAAVPFDTVSKGVPVS